MNSPQGRDQAGAKLGEVRSDAASKVDTLADSAHAAADRLQGTDLQQLSRYVESLAESMNRLSGNLREKPADALLQDVSRLARENPALFITGGVAVGFGLSRFAKASNRPQASSSPPPMVQAPLVQPGPQGSGQEVRP